MKNLTPSLSYSDLSTVVTGASSLRTLNKYLDLCRLRRNNSLSVTQDSLTGDNRLQCSAMGFRNSFSNKMSLNPIVKSANSSPSTRVVTFQTTTLCFWRKGTK